MKKPLVGPLMRSGFSLVCSAMTIAVLSPTFVVTLSGAEPLELLPIPNSASTTTANRSFVECLTHAPVIQAAHERVIASRRAIGASDRLADPKIDMGFARSSTDVDNWPMYDVGVAQTLPRWGERDAQRSRATSETTVREAELLDMLGDIAADVASLIAEADAARTKLLIVDKQIARATSLQATILARSATGNANIAEQLGVQSRLAALAVERDIQQRHISDAEQDIRAQLGLPLTTPIPAFSSPNHDTMILDRVPGILAAQAKTAEASAQFQEVRAHRYPETSVGLRYKRELQPGSPTDTIGLAFGISLPIWQSASRDLEESASARRRASLHEAAAWQNRAQSLLSRAQRASVVAAHARSAAQATSGRLDAEYDAMVRAAATQNSVSLMTILDVLDRLSDAERLVIDAETSAHLADAGLWRLSPPDITNDIPERTQP